MPTYGTVAVRPFGYFVGPARVPRAARSAGVNDGAPPSPEKPAAGGETMYADETKLARPDPASASTAPVPSSSTSMRAAPAPPEKKPLASEDIPDPKPVEADGGSRSCHGSCPHPGRRPDHHELSPPGPEPEGPAPGAAAPDDGPTHGRGSTISDGSTMLGSTHLV